ncbi:MAG: 7TM-DISM domain-containing protein [Bacteroidota bacterium]
MKNWLFYILFPLLFFQTAFVEAQEILIESNFQHTLLGNRVAIFEDKSKKMIFEEAINQKFLAHSKSSINIGFTNSYYWVKFRLKNTDSSKISLLLEISNPHINKLQLFTVKGDKVSKSVLTGDHFPFSQRPYIHPHFVFPLELNSDESAEYYLWVDKHGEQLQLPIDLWAIPSFTSYNNFLTYFVSMMLGISSLYVLISFLLWLFFRQYLTFYYFLYTLAAWVFLVAHAGFGFEYIWQNSIWWASSARPVSSILFYFFSLLFARNFFNISKKNPYLDLHTKVILFLLLVVLLAFLSQSPQLNLIKNHWYNPTFYEGNDLMIVMKATYLIILAALWSIIGIGIYFYIKTKKAENLWFTLGFSMVMISGTMVIFIFWGYVPDNYFTQNIPLISQPLEIIIISFLLANRYKNIYIQNAKFSAELADQRQQNARHLLEGQMIERHRLSQELHDGISLTLANIRLRLSMLADKTQSDEMNELVENLGVVGQDVRQFSHALSPVMLEKYGLVDAIEGLIETVKATNQNLAIGFSHDPIDESGLAILLKQTIYQITLELLNNIVRHAHAHRVELKLRIKNNHLFLEISDDGIGYEILVKSNGIGLQNIQARAESLNGKFTVKRQNKGMRHVIEIPI